MARILILTAAFGEGHNAAARGLCAAFQQLGADPLIVDIFQSTTGPLYDRSRRMYLDVINRAPALWAAIYQLVDRLPVAPALIGLMRGSRRALAQLIEKERPRAIVSVYPAYAYLIERLRHQFAEPCDFYTVITDSITINRTWYLAKSDLFFVPNEASANVIAGAGIPRAKICDFGFPVSPRFASDRAERSDPGGRNPFRVLYMVNARPALAAQTVEQLLEISGLHLTVTVGRDERLRARIEECGRGRALEILGWTDQMPELLMRHHLLIGKAGGASVQEAIAAGTPMLITAVVPGQEEGNARLLVENGCGALCPTVERIDATVRALMKDDAAQWRQWASAISRLSRPAAALEIARFVLAARK